MHEILNHLPHRHPFLMVDRILERVENERVVAEKLLTFGEACLQGHIPGHPILPGVLMVEMLAQAAAFLSSEPLTGGRFVLGQIVDARFKGSAFPGDRLRLEVERELTFGKMSRVIGKVMCEDRVLCTAKLVLVQEQTGKSA